MDSLLDSARQSLSLALLSDEDDATAERVVTPFAADDDARRKFPENVIVTSRFTLINFLPKAFFEQFRRLANVYFLVIGIIAVVGTYTSYYNSAVEPGGILMPMTVVVLISVAKDGIEDIKRHRTDAEIDALPARRVTPDGEVEPAHWKDLAVGSVVLLLCDDAIPADVLVVACGGIQGPTAYVETAAIDGESNLKIKLPCYHQRLGGRGGVAAQIASSAYCPPAASAAAPSPLVGTDADIIPAALRKCSSVGQVIAGADEEAIRQSMARPTSLDSPGRRRSVHDPGLVLVSTDKSFVHGAGNITSARLRTDAPTEFIGAFNGSILFHPDELSSDPVALSGVNLLLRGSVLRATEWCVGIVAFTGAETKLALNSKRVPSKLSSLDRVVNRTLLIAIGVMVLVCVVSALLGMLWDYLHDDATYLCLDEDDQDSCESSSTNSTGLSVFTFATLYNNFVCISMYVSLEMIYLAQSYFIAQDLALYDNETDTPAEVHSSGLCADLGQVQYVLSDKTGTITKNVMKVRRCSVGGMVYGAPMTASGGDTDGDDKLAGTVGPQLSSSSLSTTATEALGQNWARLGGLARFRGLPAGRERELIVDFLRIMAACNTVMLMPDAHTGELHVSDKASLEKCLQAESADEVALVTAAVEHAEVLLTQRDVRSIVVKGLDLAGVADEVGEAAETPDNFKEWASRSPSAQGMEGSAMRDPSQSQGSEETYEVLAVNVFDSDRKRMSVLVRIAGQVVLLCKGADTSVLPLCSPDQYSEQCGIHIDQFASSGLRTLVFAKRVLSDDEATRWLGEFLAASNSLVNRPQMLARCAVEIEQRMELLGAVGIEDELQDGVAESIQKLQETGLNFWMITGDKVETALAISRICGLMRPGMEVEKIVSLKGEALRKRLKDLLTLLSTQYLSPDEELDLEAAGGTTGGDTMRNSLSASMGRLYRGAVNRLSAAGTGCSAAESDSLNRSEPSAALRAAASKKSPQSLALAVDGASLEAIWSDTAVKAEFHKIAHIIPTVIACRVSPLQKASLVRLVKMGPGNPITLALGDGANDIGMIHEARIGVGISGREGKHAANSADFAIGQFRFIVPLLLIHGRGFSGTVYLDSIVFSGFNFYLGLPIVMLGIWDRDVEPAVVYRHPRLAYQTGRLGELLSMSNFFRWCLSAFFQGMVLFAVAIRIIAGSADASQGYDTDYKSVEIKNLHGRDGGIYVDGFFLYTCVVLCMQLKVAYMTNTWTWIHWVLWVGSTAGFVLFSWVYSQFDEIYDWYKVVDFTMGTGLFYLGLLVIAWLMYMTDTVVRAASDVLFPTSQGRLLDAADSERCNSFDSDDSERKKNLSGSGISMPERKTLSL